MLMTMNPGQSNKRDLSAAKSLEGRVWELLDRNDIKQAFNDCQQLNRQYPDFASGWHTASQLALKLNNPAMAFSAIEKALTIEPENTEWLLQQGSCLLRLGRMEQVESLLHQLSSHTVKSAYQCSALGMLLSQTGNRDQALQHYENAVALEPDEAKHYYNIACLQRSLGDIDAAENNFDQAIGLNTTEYESYKLRSELRTQTPENNHVESLEALMDEGIDDKRGKGHVCYALAKELEDLHKYERSFHFLKMGSDTRRSLMQYDIQRDLDTIAAIQNTFNTKVFDGAVEGADNSEAIFILGMPRTGTTLVERILASHSDVFAAGELNNFAIQLMKMVRAQSGNNKLARDELVEMSSRLDFKLFGESYVESTRPFTGHTDRFIDKLPLNYLYVGLIHLALPSARIINLQRDPMDTCYAIYKQLFVGAYPFSYKLEELGQYYVAYHKLMTHWNAVLPGVVHTIHYETLVNDIENEARRLLEFCDLDWQPQCLEFHKNKEASTTASTVQVRQPVYQSSVGKWRNYEKQLQPISDILEIAGISISA